VGDELLFKGTVAELPNVATFEKTFEDAYILAIDAIESLYESSLEENRPFPPALSQTESSEYSGRLTLRMPKWLHAQLGRQSESDGISLNQYLISILSAAGSINALVHEASEKIVSNTITHGALINKGMAGTSVAVVGLGALTAELNRTVMSMTTVGMYSVQANSASLTYGSFGGGGQIKETESTSPTTITFSEFGMDNYIHGNC
jgi:predicted HicB family RNase H-like nuclease